LEFWVGFFLFSTPFKGLQMKKELTIALACLIGIFLISCIARASFSVSADPSLIKISLSANHSQTYVPMNFWNPSTTDSNYTIVLGDERLKDYIRYDCNDEWKNDSRDFWCQDKYYIVKAGTPKGDVQVNLLFLKKTDYTADLTSSLTIVAKPILEGQTSGTSVGIQPQISVKTIIHQVGTESIGITISPATGSFNSTLDGTTIVFTVFNSGSQEIPVTLSLSGMAAKFSHFEPQQVTVQPKDYTRFNVTVNPDQNVTEGGTYGLKVVAKTVNDIFDVGAESNVNIFLSGARTKPLATLQTTESSSASNNFTTGLATKLKDNSLQIFFYAAGAFAIVFVIAYFIGRRSIQKTSLLAICFLLAFLLGSRYSLANDISVIANVTQGCGDGICNSTLGENCTVCSEDCTCRTNTTETSDEIGSDQTCGDLTGYIYAGTVRATASETLNSIGIHLSGSYGNGHVRTAIFDSDSRNLIAQSDSVLTVNGWNDLNMTTPVSITEGTSYIIAVQQENASDSFCFTSDYGWLSLDEFSYAPFPSNEDFQQWYTLPHMRIIYGVTTTTTTTISTTSAPSGGGGGGGAMYFPQTSTSSSTTTTIRTTSPSRSPNPTITTTSAVNSQTTSIASVTTQTTTSAVVTLGTWTAILIPIIAVTIFAFYRIKIKKRKLIQ
jgi:hypothetical protein